MNFIMRIYVFFLALCVGLLNSGNIQCQNNNAFEQLKKINDSYRDEKSYAMDVTYAIFANYSNQKAESSNRSVYIKHDDMILNKGDQTIVFQNSDKLILVNIKERKIYLSNPVKDILKNTSLQDIEKVLTKGSELKVTEKEKLKTFVVNFKSTASEYEKIIIDVDKKTNHIQKYTMYMREEMKMRYEDPSCKAEKPRMEVFIKDSDGLVNEFKMYLNESYFIQKNNNTYSASAAFKGFKVINNIIKG